MVSSPLPDVSAGPVSAIGTSAEVARAASPPHRQTSAKSIWTGSAFFPASENPIYAEGWAFAKLYRRIVRDQDRKRHFHRIADGVFENARGGLELREVDLNTNQLVVDAYYEIRVTLSRSYD